MADTSKINEILNYYGLKTNIADTKKWVKQYVGEALTGITTDLMISGTYEQIKGWRDNGELKPGMLYRMTDYVTKVYSEDGSVSSAEHPFDLILFADSNSCMNENVLPALHEGDEYFKTKVIEGDTYYKWKFDDGSKNYYPYYILTKEREFEAPSEGETVNYYNIYFAEFECTSSYYSEEYEREIFILTISNINPDIDWGDFAGEPVDLYGDDFHIYPMYVLFDDYPTTMYTGNWTDQLYVGARGVISPRKQTAQTTMYEAEDGLYQPDLMLNVDDESWEVYSKWNDKEKGILYTDGDTMVIGGKLSDQTRNDIFYDDYGRFTYDGTITIGEEVFPISLQSWEAKYSLDNDTNRFKFADTENGKGVIYYMKDEYNNEAPFDFKNILQNDGEYTFGNDGEDYSLLGYNSGIYNNKILPCVDSETGRQVINQIRVTGKDCHTNLFKPTCVNSYINFPISECDISMNNDGELVVFKTADFISGIENHTIEHDYRKDYLTFEAVNDNTEIIFKTYTDDSTCTRTIEVSKDKKNWETKTSSENGTILATLNAEEKLYLRGDNSSYAYYDENEGEYLPNFILPLNDCYVYGNIMSLIDSNNFRALTEITEEYTFYSLFYDYWNEYYSGEHVLSHEDKKLVLPSTTLASYCYYNMFNGCTSLTTAPELPATTLAQSCYEFMFQGCTSLTTAPELPATTLANYCYYYMFYDCTSLTTAPDLPATTLATACYYGMFHGCTSLTTAPELPATTLTQSCYSNMFYDCSSLTTAPELPATTLANYCYYYMFYDCTSLTTTPELPATTLANRCYSSMFQGCSSLTTTPELPATTLANRCYSSMFQGCSSLTTTPELPATTLANRCYSSMFQGCSSLTTTPELPATTLANRCYEGMFTYCTSLTTAPELPATTLADWCYQNMFNGCTNLTTAPELPATTLANYCYSSMFQGCSSLTTTPELPATTLAQSCYEFMFQGCSSLTTTPELPATTLANRCYEGMFTYCTSLTTAPELPATTLADWCYQNMFNGCTNLTTAPELPATALTDSCYESMFYDCTSLTTAPELPATTLAQYCYYRMFQGCTSLTTAPELPATTLAQYCYYRMFYDCTSLNYIKCLAVNGINQNSSTSNWVSGVQTNSGTFIKHPDATSWPTGNNGIPQNWTVEDVVIDSNE